MNDEEKKAQEAVEAEAKAKAEAEAEAAKSSSTEEKDYKAIAEANEALALAEKARADAAEALIVKNKSIAKRQDNKDETEPLTEEKVNEIVKNALASAKAEDASPEVVALKEANEKLAIQRAKTAEVVRALKASDGKRTDTATTHFDGEKGIEPKLPDNSPLKEFKFEGNGIYSQKLKSGKTMFKNVNAGPGQPKTWIA